MAAGASAASAGSGGWGGGWWEVDEYVYQYNSAPHPPVGDDGRLGWGVKKRTPKRTNGQPENQSLADATIPPSASVST